MKNLLLTTIALLTIATTTRVFAADEAFQQGADQMNEIIKCQPLRAMPDMGMQITVATGGIAGVTQVRVERFFLGHTEVTNYIVKAIDLAAGQMGEGMAYVGNGIRLTANFTTLLPNGQHYGTLQLRSSGIDSLLKLSCELVQQNPQVNYTY